MNQELGDFTYGSELDKEMNDLHRDAADRESARESDADEAATLYEEVEEFMIKNKVAREMTLGEFLAYLVEHEKKLRSRAIEENPAEDL